MDDLQDLIDLFRETAAEGKMAIIPDQFRAYLQYMPDHYVCHIRLEYLCSLNTNSCATMTARLAQKVVEAGFDRLPILCTFTNVKQIPSNKVDEATKSSEPAEKTITLQEYAAKLNIPIEDAQRAIKPEFIRIVLSK